MEENPIVENARHYFNNCKAAFRLLQGAILSGHIVLSEKERDEFEEQFVKLEKGSYDINDQSLFAVQEFFSRRKKLVEKNREAAKTISKLNIGKRKVLVVDDQYDTTGWREIFQKIFGKDNVIGFKGIREFNAYIVDNLK